MIHLDWDTQALKNESSKNAKERNKKGKNSKTIFHNCGKKGHTTNVCRSKNAVSMSKLGTWVIVISAKRKVIRHMNAKPKLCMHQDLKVTTTIVRNMDIEPLNEDPNPCGHQ